MRRLGLIRPHDFVPSPSRRSSSLDGVWSLAIAGVQETVACSRLRPPVPGPRVSRGHTSRTPPRACSVSNATSPFVSAWLYERCWAVSESLEPPCSGRRCKFQRGDLGLGRRPSGHVTEGAAPDATRITSSGVSKGEGHQGCRKEVSAQGGDEHPSASSEPDGQLETEEGISTLALHGCTLVPLLHSFLWGPTLSPRQVCCCTRSCGTKQLNNNSCPLLEGPSTLTPV